jgi:hypothetical protein
MPVTSFIPTVSALDFETDDPYAPVMEDPELYAKTPFDQVYAPRENQAHTAVNSENKTWLLYELFRYEVLVATAVW